MLRMTFKQSQLPNAMKVSVIVPFFNEEENITPLIEKLKKVHKTQPFDLIAIDDGSTDSTSEILDGAAEDLGFVHVVHHKKNSGWGAGLRSGFELSKRLGDEIAITMDGDMTHDPNDIPKLLRRINEGYDMVIGSRFLEGGGMEKVSFERELLSMVSNFVFTISISSKVKDYSSGFRAIRLSSLEGIDLESESFQINVEMIIKMEKAGLRIAEAPVWIHPRFKGKSKRKLQNEIPKYLRLVLTALRMRFLG